MFCSTFFKVIFIVNSVKVLLAIENPTRKDAANLAQSYPDVMELRLNGGHGYYMYAYLDNEHYAPSRESSAESSSRKKQVIDLFIRYFKKEQYEEAYIVVYNVLESVCYTYAYRFCKYAITMIKKNGNLTQSLENFEIFVNTVHRIFTENDFGTDSIDILKNFFNNFDATQQRNVYVEFMENVEDKINFADLVTYDQESILKKWSTQKLERFQIEEIRGAINLLQKVNIQPDESENQDEWLCRICSNTYSLNNTVYIFVPCGHTDCCFSCANKLQACPVCREKRVQAVDVNILKPTNLFGHEVWDRIPRNAIKEEARCVGCREKVPVGRRMVAIPCAHGIYCEGCIFQGICVICNKYIQLPMLIYI